MTELVTTKSGKGSTSETKIKKVKFADLWNNYPASRIKHDKDGKGTDFANHCAINVSTSLYKSGVKLKLSREKENAGDARPQMTKERVFTLLPHKI
ncbi:type VI secretion system amidase effector protein Tae4 [Enterovibrio makurazakiensis]|uniref:hypothetical protein n=1 Tax=Enterovibrio makurazakiensis TaxID=2910232 RepID=UPI003D196E3F